MMNLGLRKRKEEKGSPIKLHIAFYFSCTSSDQTSTFDGPGQFEIATGDRVTTKF